MDSEWRQDGTNGCGVCGDCQEKIHSTPWPDGKRSKVVGVCVEPNVRTLEWLLKLRRLFLTNHTDWAQWHVLWAAVHNSTTKYTAFPACNAGQEDCALDTTGKHTGAFERVEVVSIDDILEQYRLPYVDILKMDTEGFDYPALLSGLRSLAAGRVGVLEFEYHEVNAWKTHTLKETVELLSDLNYVCYYSGKKEHQLTRGGSLVRITGCWHDQFEMHAWSNVVCVRRDHYMYAHMERLSCRHTLMGSNTTYYPPTQS